MNGTPQVSAVDDAWTEERIRALGVRTNDVATYLTTSDVAKRYQTAESTIRYWRSIGYGPRGTKVGRKVLYPFAEIQRFDAEIEERAAAG